MDKKLVTLLLLCLAAVVSGFAGQDYTGHKVVRAFFENEKQLAVVHSWELDVWSRDSALGLGWNDIFFFPVPFQVSLSLILLIYCGD